MNEQYRQLPESGYRYSNSALTPANHYLLPVVLQELQKIKGQHGYVRIFELGCGNGAAANVMAQAGYEVVGVDSSQEGIENANQAFPLLRMRQRSAYDDLSSEFGQYPVVVSLEVVEHMYFPRRYAATIFRLLEPGGVAIISTPFHGYWKNLTLALTGKMDAHFTALWDYGHIKFWSVKTLSELLREAGFVDIRFRFVGRIPILAKSMIAIARRPSL